MRLLNKRGDTIIEVVLALTLLSSVLMISWNMTNRSTRVNLAAQKRIEMVAALKEQAELLTVARDNNKNSISKFYGSNSDSMIKDSWNMTATEYDTLNQSRLNPCSSYSFTNAAFRPSKAYYLSLDPETQAVTATAGTQAVGGDSSKILWIQSYQQTDSTDPNTRFVNFYVRGCWQTTNSGQNTDNSHFVLRLNL